MAASSRTRRSNPRQSARREVLAATPRERIDRAAYDLFSRRGIRAVGIDEVIAQSGVAKAMFGAAGT